jgi:hypothetical protein
MHMIRKGQLRSTGTLRLAQQFNSLTAYASSVFSTGFSQLKNWRQHPRTRFILKSTPSDAGPLERDHFRADTKSSDSVEDLVRVHPVHRDHQTRINRRQFFWRNNPMCGGRHVMPSPVRVDIHCR